MKLPDSVIDELRSIDIPYGKIVIFVNEKDMHVDITVEDRKRIKVNIEHKKIEKI